MSETIKTDFFELGDGTRKQYQYRDLGDGKVCFELNEIPALDDSKRQERLAKKPEMVKQSFRDPRRPPLKVTSDVEQDFLESLLPPEERGQTEPPESSDVANLLLQPEDRYSEMYSSGNAYEDALTSMMEQSE